MEVIKDKKSRYDPVLKIFALSAFHNILSFRPGRLAFLSTAEVKVQGEKRKTALEIFYEERFTLFNK